MSEFDLLEGIRCSVHECHACHNDIQCPGRPVQIRLVGPIHNGCSGNWEARCKEHAVRGRYDQVGANLSVIVGK